MVETAGEDADGAPLINSDFFDPHKKDSREWIRKVSVHLDKALDEDWCHGLGSDEKGLLLWKTEKKKQWEQVFAVLAECKIAFRTQFQFRGGGPHQSFATVRFWLIP